MGRGKARWLFGLVLVAGCAGNLGPSGDAFEETPIVLPPWDVASDPGAPPPADPGREPDLLIDPDSGILEDAEVVPDTSLDLAVEDTPDVPEDTAPDPTDAPSGDVLPDPAGDTNPGPCAPGQANCTCVDETDCDPAYDLPCRPNRCDVRTGRCMLDSGFLEGLACEDGDPCTTGETCRAGGCKGGVVTCECRRDDDCVPDDDPCTDDRCEEGHCVHPYNQAPCDDGDGCTSGDACLDGVCMPGARVCQCDGDARCDDGIPCTEDRCLEGVCVNALSIETCLIQGQCVAAGTSEPGNPCRACDPETSTDDWSDAPPDTPCDDDDPCTAPDGCLAGACIPGVRLCECAEARFCDDGNPCTDDACVDFTCTHEFNTAPCEDGDPVTAGDRCAGGVCVPGLPCGDGVCARPEETCATCPADCGGPCPATETLCTNGWDDDLDGATDCGDEDCRFDAACLPPNACAVVDATIGCGYTVTYDWSEYNDLKGTACGVSLGGDDTIWQFSTPTTREVTFRVENPSGSRMMSAIVLAGACNGAACIQAATGSPAIVKFTALAGRTYYLVYDEIIYMARVKVTVSCQ